MKVHIVPILFSIIIPVYSYGDCIGYRSGTECFKLALQRTDVCRDFISYMGTKNVTLNGDTCLVWDSSHANHRVNLAQSNQNYCRNPDQSAVPWCYFKKDNSHIERAPCFDQCQNVTKSKLFQPFVRGTWNVQSVVDFDHCIQSDTTDDNNNVDKKCYIPKTINSTCAHPFAFVDRLKTTVNNLECLNWRTMDADIYKPYWQTNYCRNPGLSKIVPWCMTTKGWQYCFKPCDKESLCKYSCFVGDGECWSNKTECTDQYSYLGFKNITQTEWSCQYWNSTEYVRHNYVTDAIKEQNGLGEHNYCRNPDNNSKGPWCFVQINKWNLWMPKWQPCYWQ